MRSCAPQKQPPARTARSSFMAARSSFMAVLHLVQVTRVTLGLHVVAGNEAQRRGVDAVAQAAAVLGAVGKDMTQMAVAMRRAHLGAAFPGIRALVHVGGVEGPREAGPAAARVELVG